MTDSPWASVAATAKTFRLPFDYVLYEMSWANCVLYGASLPSYSSKKDDKGQGKGKGGSFRADDPANRGRLDDFFNKVKD